MKNLTALKNKFGSVTFEGKTYILADQADMTSRLLPGPWNYHEVPIGEEYQFEMSCPAYDADGIEYAVYWIFTGIKGDEPELDTYDYDKVDRVVEN